MASSPRGHFFISYSHADGTAAALRIYEALAASGTVRLWIDKRDTKPGLPGWGWQEQIAEALGTCIGLILVGTPGSVNSQECTVEWRDVMQSMRYVLPVLVEGDAVPPRLQQFQIVDARGDFEAAIRQLRSFVEWAASPEGQHRYHRVLLDAALRDRERASAADRPRHDDRIRVLREYIAQHEKAVADPELVSSETERRIEEAIEREKAPPRVTYDTHRSRFINQPPATAPPYFQNREVETSILLDWLRDGATRLITVVGRAGVGKTAFSCRLLKELERERIPGEGSASPVEVDGIVYLSSIGRRRVTFSAAYADLLRLLPRESRDRIDQLAEGAPARDKMLALLEEFTGRPVLLLLDNLEDELEPQSGRLRDRELADALQALLDAPAHSLKVIVTTRVPPQDFVAAYPPRHRRLSLDEGLEAQHAENVLRALDEQGKLGLRDASPALLARAQRVTRGLPRALEALAGILGADPDATLERELERAERLAPNDVVKALVGDAFSRLDPAAQRVMQALAVFGRPVPTVAVDYLLQPFAAGVDSQQTLTRLVSMHLVRKEPGGDRYYLHQVDRSYALDRISEMAESETGHEGAPTFTRSALRTRAAAFFHETRRPTEEWTSPADLEPLLAEFDLLTENEAWDAALRVAIEAAPRLYLWAENETIVRMHERLAPKIVEPRARVLLLERLGRGYRCIGRADDGARCLEEALLLANRKHEPNELYGVLIDLGGCYSETGDELAAIDAFEEAFSIIVRLGFPDRCSVAIANLSACYSEIGRSDVALEYATIAVELLRRGDADDRMNEGLQAHNVSLAKIDLGRYEEAAADARAGLRIGEEIGNPAVCAFCYEGLVLASLLADDTEAAWRYSTAARSYRYPEVSHHAHVLRGVVALERHDTAAACEAFEEALGEVDRLLSHSKRTRRVLDSKALALVGLAICGDRAQGPAARDTFVEARETNSNHGDIARVMRLLDRMVPRHRIAEFADVRDAAARPSPRFVDPSTVLDEGARLRNIATFCLRDKRPDRACELLGQLVDHERGRPDADAKRLVSALDMLSLTLERLGRAPEVLAVRLEALVTLAENGGISQADLVTRFKDVANRYVALDRFDEADEVYQAALERLPEHANLLGVYGFFVYSARRNVEKAARWFDRSLAVSALDPNILANHAMLCLSVKAFQRAEHSLREALALRLKRPDRSSAKVLVLSALLAMLRGTSGEPFLRYLKTLVERGFETVEWSTEFLLESVGGDLLEEDRAFMAAVLRAVGNDADRAALATLERWRRLVPTPLSDLAATAGPSPVN